MKIKATLAIICSMLLAIAWVSAEEEPMKMENMHQHGHQMMQDDRISLNLPPHMKKHQLANMRNHLDAISRIINAISEQDFANASQIASGELGSTPKMMKMCKMMKNEAFRERGLAFHKSADDLAVILKKADEKESLQALGTTMSHCVGCHATFRQ